MLADLFFGAIADQGLHRAIFIDECVDWFMSICLSFDRVRCREEVFVGEYLTEFFAVDRLALHIHGVCCEGPLESLDLKHSISAVSPRQRH